MKILIQNLEKISGLANDLLHKYNPDVMLAQEINLPSENSNDDRNSYKPPAHNTSKIGYGTAIYSTDTITNIKFVNSPYAEFGGVIYKKTTVVTTHGIQFVSFHGYNGTPFRNVDKLVAHVDAVLSVLSSSGPAVFAGDFNTWTQSHLDAVKQSLEKAGFHLSYSWPYPGRDFPLDHAFTRDIIMQEDDCYYYSCASDHNGAELTIKKA